MPIEPAAKGNRQVIEWDKDDIDALRFMKVDVLGLGMLGCMRRAFDLLADGAVQRLDFATIPAEDPATYEMIPTRHARHLPDRVARANVDAAAAEAEDLLRYRYSGRDRPARPIQGDMVHPYLRRREGLEQVEYPTPELRRVLEKTLGVPLFQEQAMQVAIVCAGFTPGEADPLRRSMATFKFTGGVLVSRKKMISGMLDAAIPGNSPKQTFSQIEGFGSYGFPESHAASFALIAYASAWLKCHHPDVFCCRAAERAADGILRVGADRARRRIHGVVVRPVCINASLWDRTIEHGPAAPEFQSPFASVFAW